MNNFEQYLQELMQSMGEVNLAKFSLNLAITALLSGLLGVFYVRFGGSMNNRSRFARNFLPLALTTMLIIFIVKSSVALSLGLVGALSIVRFRAAIKDPEELTYLFLSIGIGLAAGADAVFIAVIAFVCILAFLFVQHWLRSKAAIRRRNAMHLHLTTKKKEPKLFSDTLSAHLPFVELRRLDETQEGLTMAFVVEVQNLEQLDTVRKVLLEKAGDLEMSWLEPTSVAL